MNPKIFLVGGAVRDRVLGLVPKDCDFVVVGADAEWMIARGFKRVGLSFPVYLHPETGDEYALARKEKKVGPGYGGFEVEFGPHVTLEDDLIRRDLTMNAMAIDLDTNEIIDPHGGMRDLAEGIIRHTSVAFAEDPLRVLRAARFAARYNFTVAFETLSLCRQLVDAGELDALSADRVWAEIEKLYGEPDTNVGLLMLDAVGALKTPRLKGLIAPGTYDSKTSPSLQVVDKLFFTTTIARMDVKQLAEFRIPTHLARHVRFIDAVCSLVTTAARRNELDPAAVVTVFDRFRGEVQSGLITETLDMLVSQSLMSSTLALQVQRGMDALCQLDFTDMVKSISQTQIKNFVRDVKIAAVSAHL